MGPTNMGPPTAGNHPNQQPTGPNSQHPDGPPVTESGPGSQDNGPNVANPVTSIVTTGPDGTPLDDGSQQSTLSNTSVASGEDPQCSTPKSSKNEPYTPGGHLAPPNASPGTPHNAHEDFEMNSPTWPSTPASPVFNSHHPHTETFSSTKKSDSLTKLYEMDDNPDSSMWLDKLLGYMEERSTPITACPTMSKQALDLYKLYLLVKERGGFLEVCKKVTKSKTWKDIAGLLGIGASSSAAYTLSKHYTKNILPFECHFDRGGVDPSPMIQQVEGGGKKGKNKVTSVPSPGSSNSQDSFPTPGSSSASMDGYNAYPGGYPPPNATPGDYNSQASSPPSQQSNAQSPHLGAPYQGGPGGYGQYGPTPDQYGPMPGAPPGQYPPGQQQNQFPPANRPMYPGYGPPPPPPESAEGATPPNSAAPPTPGDPYSGYGTAQSPYPPPPAQPTPQQPPQPQSQQQPPQSQSQQPQTPQQQQQQQHPQSQQSSQQQSPPTTGPSSSAASGSTPPASGMQTQAPSSGAGPYPPPPQPYGDYRQQDQSPPPPSSHPDFAKDQQQPYPYSQSPQMYPGWQNNSGQYRGQYPPQGAPQQWNSNAPSPSGPPPGPGPWQDQNRYPPNQSGSPYPPHQQAQQQPWTNMPPSSQNSSLRPPAPRVGGGKPFAQMSNVQPNVVGGSTGPAKPLAAGQFPPQSGVPPKRDIVFPSDSVESTTPVLYRRKRIAKLDVGQTDPWRMFMALSSGLLVESTWALDVLNILLFDDTSVTYFGLSHLPGLLNLLLDHFQKSLADMFDSDTTKKTIQNGYGWYSQLDEESYLTDDDDNDEENEETAEDDDSDDDDEEEDAEGEDEDEDESLFNEDPSCDMNLSKKVIKSDIKLENGDLNEHDDSTNSSNNKCKMTTTISSANNNSNNSTTSTVAAGQEDNKENIQLSSNCKKLMKKRKKINNYSKRKKLFVDLGSVTEMPNPDDSMVMFQSTTNYTMTSRKGLPVKFQQSDDDMFVLDHRRSWDKLADTYYQTTSTVGGDPWTDGHNEPDAHDFVLDTFKAEFANIPFSKLIKSKHNKKYLSQKSSILLNNKNNKCVTNLNSVSSNSNNVNCISGKSNNNNNMNSDIKNKMEQNTSTTNNNNNKMNNQFLTSNGNSSNNSNSNNDGMTNSSSITTTTTTTKSNLSMNLNNFMIKKESTTTTTTMTASTMDSDCRHIDMELEKTNSLSNGPQDAVSSNSNSNDSNNDNNKCANNNQSTVTKMEIDEVDDEQTKLPGGEQDCNKSTFDVSDTMQDPSNLLKRRRMSDYEDECYTRDEASLFLVTESQDSLARRCVALSNILRNLTFLPGNEIEFARSSRFLAMLGKLLLLHHDHPMRTKKTSNYDREEDADFADSCSSLQGESEWWWDFLMQMRENMLVATANISGHMDLSRFDESVSRPVLDGLLHWAICPSAHGQDPFPTLGPNSVLSPQRLALEALCKLCVTDANVDLVMATPPFSRLEKLCSVLTRHLCKNEDQVLREFSVNLLHYLAAADSTMSRTVAMQSPCVSYLVAFIEQAEQTALGVANQHGINFLRDNPDSMGTSLDMLSRAAGTLLHLARHPDNRPLFMQQEQRLLGLVMSHILDQQVALIISRVLYQCSRGQGPLTSSDVSAFHQKYNRTGFSAMSSINPSSSLAAPSNISSSSSLHNSKSVPPSSSTSTANLMQTNSSLMPSIITTTTANAIKNDLMASQGGVMTTLTPSSSASAHSSTPPTTLLPPPPTSATPTPIQHHPSHLHNPHTHSQHSLNNMESSSPSAAATTQQQPQPQPQTSKPVIASS
uniref:Putative swi-snf chromatin-remodeling complex protein n=1 Tax=Corethrella appendiculata TaxID=1370023 RepID=W4VR84_9DIPT